MRLIQVYVPQHYLEALEDLVREGMYPNRSEAIRLAVRDLINRSDVLVRTLLEGEARDREEVIED